MPSPAYTPRRHPTRLPLHHQKPHHYGNRHAQFCTRRWIIRYLALATIVFFLLRHWMTTPSTSSALGDSTSSSGYHHRQNSFPELKIARNVKVTPPGDRIPKICHFIHGLRGPEPTLDLIHYLAIKAAHEVIKPDKIYLHYHYMPVGEMFERVKPMVTLRQVPLVNDIFGRPVSHFAHRADVVRLEALLKFGGIYFDLDLFALKPVDHLLDEEFVMGQEGIGGSSGLCNAMMMARPNARFLQRYYATYATFDYTQWNYHSVILPGKLAPHFSEEITVLGHKSFFWPLWDAVGLRTLFLEKTYDFSDNLGTHIWESPAKKHLIDGVTEDTILNVDNSLYCAIRPLVLDGRPDPRPNACRILTHTGHSDKLMGHWPLDKQDPSQPSTNPMRADDNSGNNLGGIIRNANFDKDGIHTTGLDSYIFLTVPTETKMDTLSVSWWMKTNTNKENGTAVVIQTDRAKVYVRTEKTHAYRPKSLLDPLSLGLATVVLEDDWTWRDQPDLLVHANPYAINQDNAYHHFVLVVDRHNVRHSMDAPLSLFMDGHVIASSSHWTIPDAFDATVRGVWFGSSEPEHSNYQDPWDNGSSLEAWYRDIRIWERTVSIDEIRQLASEQPFMPTTTTSNSNTSFANDTKAHNGWVSADSNMTTSPEEKLRNNQEQPLWQSEDDQELDQQQQVEQEEEEEELVLL